MSLMDEFREEREAMKHGTLKQKLAYFWQYYKWQFIISICLIIAVTSLIYQAVTRKDTALYGLFLNTYASEEATSRPLHQGYMAAVGLDADTSEIILNTTMFVSSDPGDQNTYNTMQMITTLVAAREVDVMAAGKELFAYYAYRDFYEDLRKLLTPEQIEAYTPYFFYIDGKVFAAKQEAAATLEEDLIPYPDPSKPEEMEDPIPVGIFLKHASEEFTDSYIVEGDDAAIGYVVNSTRPENAVSFLDYIFAAQE